MTVSFPGPFLYFLSLCPVQSRHHILSKYTKVSCHGLNPPKPGAKINPSPLCCFCEAFRQVMTRKQLILSLSPAGYCLTLNIITNWLPPNVLLLCDCLMGSWEMTHSTISSGTEGCPWTKCLELCHSHLHQTPSQMSQCWQVHQTLSYDRASEGRKVTAESKMMALSPA